MLVYLGGAWVIIEASNHFANRFDWRDKIGDIIFLIFVFGLPAAIFYAWFHGKQGVQKVQKKELFFHSLNLTIAVFFIYRVILAPELDRRRIRGTTEIQEVDTSIAVLPFVNLNDDPTQKFFSDGITEDILNHLTKIGDLYCTSLAFHIILRSV